MDRIGLEVAQRQRGPEGAHGLFHRFSLVVLLFPGHAGCLLGNSLGVWNDRSTWISCASARLQIRQSRPFDGRRLEYRR